MAMHRELRLAACGAGVLAGVLAWAILACSGSAARADDAPGVPGFRQDVMPILFRAGCNAGTCHGSARGKDGFMLSLFGYDPQGDYRRMVEDIPGRRVNTAVPEESLLVLKATGGVPHTGGKLFDRDSDLYKTLVRWIEAGARNDAGPVPEVVRVSLPKESVVFNRPGQRGVARVTADYSDGTSRDVTHLARFFSNNPAVATIDADGTVSAVSAGDTNVFARYARFTVGAEVIVMPDASDGGEAFVWPDPPTNNFIDKIVFDRLRKLRIVPSDVCDDETFLRRVTLDLAARPPTVEEYHAFMADTASDKRSRKIDELLAGDAFADLWTTIWCEQMKVVAGPHAFHGNHQKAAAVFVDWVRAQMRGGRPLDEFVADMVGATGSTVFDGPVNMYPMLINSWKVDPKKLSADISHLFLGVQIQCAECHNHPFDRWTMDDYYSFMSFFTGVSRKKGAEVRDHRYYFDPTIAPAKHPVSGRPMPPRVLGGLEPVAGGGDPRQELARWLTAADNEFFSRNLANRIWAQLLGRGIVDPVDDIRVSNPPTNPALLEALAKRLVELKFDLRGLVRDICRSRVYQLAAHPTPSNRLDTRQFSHFQPRRLRADVLLDAIVAVTNVPRSFANFPEGTRAIDFYPFNISTQTATVPEYGDTFFHTFGRSGRNTVAVATKLEPTLSQTLHLMVGDSLRDRLAGDVVKKLVETKSTPQDIIESLFIRTLCRRPTATEIDDVLAIIPDAGKDPAPYQDLLWSLLNSTEFMFTH